MSLAPSDADWLDKTRSTVLNLVVAAGFGIAFSGGLLRWRDRWAVSRAPASVGYGLTVTLIALGISSYLVRRTLSGRGALRDPETRGARLFRGHVASAALAVLAVPLGLAYGWFVRPRLDAVAPFWVVALALGLLAFPRSRDLQDFDAPRLDPDTNGPPA